MKKEIKNTGRRQLTTGVTTPEELATKLIRENRDGGCILVDDFCSQLPSQTRHDCIQVLKYRMPGSVFIPGRKGYKTRWIYGKMAQQHKDTHPENPPVPARRPVVSKPAAQPVSNVTELDPNKFKVKLTVHGQEIFVTPEKAELVPA